MSKASQRVDAFPAETIGEKHAFLKGYALGEKDAALTPEDIGVIYNLVRNRQYLHDDMWECYKDVLELFNEAKRDAEKERG